MEVGGIYGTNADRAGGLELEKLWDVVNNRENKNRAKVKKTIEALK